jgi:Protein of unknown function (DUF4446)
VSDLGSTAGTAALIAGGIAAVALLLAVVLAVRLGRLRRDQLAVLGDGTPSDLVAHARDLQRGFAALEARVEELGNQTSATADRLEGAISHCAVVRYDAYDEMTGRQSSSVALLDDHRNGVVLSSILQREQARLYAKGITAGRSELGLSPEEQAALDAALGGDRAQ